MVRGQGGSQEMRGWAVERGRVGETRGVVVSHDASGCEGLHGCLPTGWSPRGGERQGGVPSFLSASPSCSLANVWTPCLFTCQWNSRRGMHMNPVQSTSSPSRPPAPERRRSRCHELLVTDYRTVDRHVEVTSDEVDVKSDHVRVESLQK